MKKTKEISLFTLTSLIVGISACTSVNHQQQVPTATRPDDWNDLRKQIVELQKVQGRQSAIIDELNNKIVVLTEDSNHGAKAPQNVHATGTAKSLSAVKAAVQSVAPASKAEIPPPPLTTTKVSDNVVEAGANASPEAFRKTKFGNANLAPSVGAQKIYEQALIDAKKPQLNDLEKDIELLLRSYKDSPATNNALYLFGETYFERKDYEKSAEQFERLYRLFPDGNKAVGALFRLGLCYKNAGHTNEAKEAFQNLINIYPGSLESQLAQKELQADQPEEGGGA